MLCTLTKSPIDNPDYLYEMKWDGYRIVAFKDGAKIRMNSCSGLDYTSKYPPVAKAIRSLDHDVILDREVVVFNKEGRPDFDAVQLYNGHDTPIKYCVFDLLYLDGADLTELPLEQQKNLLKELTKNDDTFYYSESLMMATPYIRWPWNITYKALWPKTETAPMSKADGPLPG